MIALDQVSYHRGARALLHQVTHKFEPGHITVLLGANGAGKSSFIRICSGEWKPVSGRVLWQGRCLSSRRISELARHRAVVSQIAPPVFSFRVLDVVLLGRLPHTRYPGMNDTDIAHEALDLVGLTGMEDRTIDTMSGGECQRVHLARAIAQLYEARKTGAGVLLLDEPTSNLDLAHQQRVLHLARRLSREGLTVLTVLHDVNLAASIADHVLLMRHGQLFAAGTASDVLTRTLLHEALQIELELISHNTGRTLFVPVLT